MGNVVKNLPYKIIKVIQDNVRYLLEHPKQLAWCMLCYDRMHMAVRYSGIDTDNPKYIFIDNPETDWPGLSQKELDFIYEAWGFTVSNDIPRDKCLGAVPKKNMTLDEWVELQLDPEYEYASLYKNRHYVINRLFCVIGTGISWNEDGFISGGINGIDEVVFYGYSQAENEVEPRIRNKIKKICNDKRVRYWFDILYSTAVEFNQLTGSQKAKLIHNIFYIGAASIKNDHTFMLCHIRNAKNDIFEKPKNRFDDLIKSLAEASGKTTEEAAEKIESIISDTKDTEDSDQQKAYDNGTFFYPISENYSNISKIPDNAHISYVREAVRIAKLIVSGKAVTYGNDPGSVEPANAEMIKVAQKVLDKWKLRA